MNILMKVYNTLKEWYSSSNQNECISITYNSHLHKSTHCPISLEPFETNEVIIILPCKHIFSQESIFTWLQLNATCPLCRYSLNKHNEPRRTLYHRCCSNILIIWLSFHTFINIVCIYLITVNR